MLLAKVNHEYYFKPYSIQYMIDKLKAIYDKITVAVAIPLGLGFVVLGVFGQLCLDNLPYLTC